MRPDTKLWTTQDDAALTREVLAGKPLEEIARHIGRTPAAIRNRAYVLRLGLGRQRTGLGRKAAK